VPFIVISGAAGGLADFQQVDTSGVTLLSKPFTAESLLRAVAQATQEKSPPPTSSG
jgi:FixJ family two-component response regulator